MKNILKRGTSLLLVVAMLLSFAVVVGAEDTTSTSPMTLRVGDVPLEAGKEALVPVYATIAAGVQITYLDLAVSCDTGVTIKGMEDRIATGGYDASGRPAYNDGELKYLGGNIENHFLEDGKLYKIGWIAQSGAWLTTTNSPLFWIRVEATTDTPVGGYEIKLGANPSAAEVGKVFGVNDENSEDGVHHYGESDTKVEDGAAIVYDPQNLPMVALTKTTFDVPKMEDWLDPSLNNMAGKYDLSKYLKIVDTDTDGTVKVFDVETVTSEDPWPGLYGVQFNAANMQLIIDPRRATEVAKDGTLKIDSATAGTHTVRDKTVTFKIAKDEPTLWKASFADYNDSYLSAQNFMTNEAPDGTINAPAQSVSAPKQIALNQKLFDQYGQTYTGEENVSVAVKLFSDSGYSTDAPSDYANYVKINGTKLEIYKDLPTNVYCELKVYVTGQENNDDTLTKVRFMVESTKPHATSAEIVLKDVKGNQYTDSQGKPLYIFTIPAPGQNPVQIKIDAKILDQNKNEMIGSDKPGFTASASFGTTAITSESTNGLSLSENTLTITSEALSLLKSATGRPTITVTVSVTGTNVTATETITLTKAQSVATSIGSEATEGGKTVLVSGRIDLMAESNNLPGIGKTINDAAATRPLYVIDQYGQHVENDGKNVTVPAENFKLYPAEKAGDGDVENAASTEKYKKTSDTPISETYVTFKDNGTGGVALSLTNAWDDNTNGLALPEGPYIIEATYPAENGGTLKAKCLIMLVKATGQWLEYTATVTASTETIYVPYASEYGTLGEGKSSEVTLRATVKNQYGEEITEGVTLAKVGNDIDLYDSNDNHVIKLDNNSTAAYVSEQNGTVRISVSEDLAKYMVKDGTVVTNGELRLPVKVTVTDKDGKTLKTFEGLTAKVKVSREASALKKATVVMRQGETVVQTVNLDERPDNQKKVNIISPKANTTYTFTVTGKDQYGDPMATTYALSDGKPNQTGFTRDGQTLKVDANAEGEVVLDVVQSPAGMTYRVTLTFAKMQFVTSADGDTPYTIDQVLGQSSAEYNGKQWLDVVRAATKQDANSTVYIQGETTPIPQDKIAIRILDEKGAVICNLRDAAAASTDLSKNPKADAGEYTVEIVYVKGENDEYEVCHGSFKIEPKEVTIVLDPAVTDAKIEKEYDGKTDLPTSGLYLSPDGLVGPDANHIDSVSIDPSALKFAKKDADTGIAIQLVEGKDCLKLNDGTQEGSPATNYTVKLDANENVEGLTGTINKKALDVYVAFYSKNWDSTATVGGYTPVLNQSGIVDGETVGVNASLSGNALCFNSSNVGATLVTEKESSITATLTGADAGNYEVGEITYGGVNGQDATITKATFTLNASDLNKTYTYGETVNLNVAANLLKKSTGQSIDEATVNAIGNTSITLTLDKNNGRYNVGTYTATVSVPTNQQNYTVDLKGMPTIKINQRDITIALKNGVKISKMYDGTNNKPSNITDASFDVTVAGGEVSGETVKLNVGELKYADANASENPIDISVGSNFWSIEGGDKSNYRFEGLNSLTGTINKYTLRVMPKSMSDLVYGSCDTAIGDALKADGTGNLTRDVLPLGYAAPRFNGTMVLKNADGTQATKTNGHYDVGTYTVTQGDVTETTGNYEITFETRTWEVKKAAADSALNDRNDLKATRNKTNEIKLTPNYPITSTPTIRVVDGSEWIDGTPTVEVTSDGKIKITLPVEDGKVEDTSKVKLELTIPESGNYNQTVKEFDVKIIDKLVQDQFEIVQGASGTYSYSKGSLQLTTSGKAEGSTVTWSIADADKVYAEVNANGYVTFKKPTTTGIIITAAASETNDYAAASDTYTLTITKGQVTITASSATMTANDPLPGFSATASGLNPKDSVSDVFQTLTATVSTDGKTAGTYRVTPNAVFKTGVKDWNEYYELSFVQGTLTVNPAVSVIDTVLPTIIAGNGCANGYANCACESFYDLDASRWYHEAIDWAYNLGLMNGTTKSTFGPNAAATRAQTWTMLARIAGQDTRRSSTWYEVGQKWAMNLGITDGTNPMGSLTREQLAAMLYRYVGSPAVNGTLTFTDSANVSAWARNAMIWAVQNGILDGVGGNRLNPKGTTTRAQAAAIFMRFSKLINK